MPVGTKNSVVPGCGMHHIALQTRDWDESLRLYRDTLGMTYVTEFQVGDRKAVLLDTGDGSYIELFSPSDSTPTVDSAVVNDPVTHLSFATTDARAAVEQARSAGFIITGEARDAQVGSIPATVAFVQGPNGEIIEFFEVR